MVQQSQVENPLTSNEMLESVLGRRSGYVRGLGYGAKPPSRRGMSTLEVEARVSSALDTVREQLEEERAKRAEMEKKLQEQYELERARRMEIEHKQLDLQAQVSALMAVFNQVNVYIVFFNVLFLVMHLYHWLGWLALFFSC